MKTKMHVMRPAASTETREVEFKTDEPSLAELRALIQPLLDGGRLEHVAVLWNGKRADMFVDEFGLLKGLPRNDAATQVYRNNSLTQDPSQRPEGLSHIVGPAVLFDDIVWT